MEVTDWGSVEPSTLDELQAMAAADLEALKPGVLLKWALIQARLHGRSHLAATTLQHYEQRQRDFIYRRLMPVDETTMEFMVLEGVKVETIARARAEYEEFTACAKAAEHVMALLERALRQRATKSQQQKNPQRRAA